MKLSRFQCFNLGFIAGNAVPAAMKGEWWLLVFWAGLAFLAWRPWKWMP